MHGCSRYFKIKRLTNLLARVAGTRILKTPRIKRLKNVMDPQDFDPRSRRQKLIGMVRNTRDSIFTATPLEIPETSKIIVYNDYTRHDGAGYLTNVHVWMYSMGNLNRKNRLLLSLARQMTKIEQAVDSAADNVLKQRLVGFLAKSVPNAPLTITIGSDKPSAKNLTSKQVYTDVSGTAHICMRTFYRPSVVQVACSSNEKLYAFEEPYIIDDGGVSIISDVDDTIRSTGIIGEKRELFRNILVKEFLEVMVRDTSKWYSDLQSRGCNFHYVSSGPWQFYLPLKAFLQECGFPHGSVHLTRYSGNIISKLMEPSAQRKKPALLEIFKSFPQQKFILIGDSGEQDVEAYLDLAAKFPHQVLAIYIRAVPGSFSDFGNDSAVLAELQNIKVAPLVPKKPLHLRGTPVTRSRSISDLSDDESVEYNRRAEL